VEKIFKAGCVYYLKIFSLGKFPRKNMSVRVLYTQIYVSEESRKKSISLEYGLLGLSGLWFNGGKGINTLFALIKEVQYLSFKVKCQEA